MLRAFGNFRRALVPLYCDLMNQSGTLVFGACLQQNSSQHMAPTCRGLAPHNHKMQGQLTNRIGVFRHRSTALFKHANQKREFVSCLTSPRLQNLKRGREALAKPREREDTHFSVLRKKGRLVNKSRIHKFKYLHTRFRVTSKEGRVV
jgi:hypothetical protein